MSATATATATPATTTPAAAPRVHELPSRRELLDRVARPVLRLGNHRDLELDAFLRSPLGRRLADQVNRGERLTFLLPAFPAKSANREKTHGPLPDLGEVLGLRALDAMAREIGEVHGPGAEVVIASDGRVFNDLVMVSDQDLEAYREEIERILVREGLTHLRTFSLEDCAGTFAPGREREELVAGYGPTVEEVREGMRACPDQRAMGDGIHRFLKDDLRGLLPELSRNQVMKRSKALAYQVVQRSRSWDGFLETVFPEALRLSIHPYPLAHRKFGVRLVAAPDRWATPWHSVTVEEGGRFVLRKRAEALALGARPATTREGYVYYVR